VSSARTMKRQGICPTKKGLIMHKSLVFASLLVPALLLSGCNTTKGIGQDIKSVGKTIERAAD